MFIHSPQWTQGKGFSCMWCSAGGFSAHSCFQGLFRRKELRCASLDFIFWSLLIRKESKHIAVSTLFRTTLSYSSNPRWVGLLEADQWGSATDMDWSRGLCFRALCYLWLFFLYVCLPFSWHLDEHLKALIWFLPVILLSVSRIFYFSTHFLK